LNNSSIIII